MASVAVRCGGGGVACSVHQGWKPPCSEWMRDSLVEIFKNLRKAPLFVHVYSDSDGNSTAARLRTEKAVPENWLTMKTEWETGMRRGRKT
ncbi:hypothetical protein ACOSQ4_017549 [Xanthoceras sorbifolium]